MNQNENKKPEHEINIVIDKKHHKVLEDTMTGNQLKTLGNVPSDYELWQEVPGGIDKLVNINETIHLKSGMKFFSVKPNIDAGGL